MNIVLLVFLQPSDVILFTFAYSLILLFIKIKVKDEIDHAVFVNSVL